MEYGIADEEGFWCHTTSQSITSRLNSGEFNLCSHDRQKLKPPWLDREKWKRSLGSLDESESMPNPVLLYSIVYLENRVRKTYGKGRRFNQ